MNKKMLYEKYFMKPQVSKIIKESKEQQQETTEVVLNVKEKTEQEKIMDEFKKLFGI